MYYTKKMIITILAIAAVLAIIGFVFIAHPFDAFEHGLISYDWFAANIFSGGVFAIGAFSAGIFSVGIFSVGIFSFGVFSLGIFSLGPFSLALYFYLRSKKRQDTSRH